MLSKSFIHDTILARVATTVVRGQGEAVPGKWSHGEKRVSLLEAARLVTCQMTNRSQKQGIVLTLSQSIPPLSCWPKIKDRKVRETELLQRFLWVQWLEWEQRLPRGHRCVAYGF